MSRIDEPIFASDAPASDRQGLPLRDRVAQLVQAQPYGVLCVQSGGQPYGALVAIAFSDDLCSAVFATPQATRKVRALNECDQVAVVVDSRASDSSDFMGIEAVTATGRATLQGQDAEGKRHREVLLRKHPYLERFVEAPTCALYCIEVVRYLHVVRFQEVSQWQPTAPTSST